MSDRADTLIREQRYREGILERTVPNGAALIKPIEVTVSPPAQELLANTLESTIIEYAVNGERRIALVVYFNKILPLHYTQLHMRHKLSRIIQRLFDAALICQGFLLTPHTLPIPGGRTAVVFYVATDAGIYRRDRDERFSKDILNEFLGNTAFMNEGEIGNADWSNL